MNKRPIQTIYYFDEIIVKVNRAAHSNSAVLRCVDHMQLNNYGANVAEVFDEDSGVLHAVITRSMKTQRIEIVFKREVKDGM